MGYLEVASIIQTPVRTSKYTEKPQMHQQKALTVSTASVMANGTRSTTSTSHDINH